MSAVSTAAVAVSAAERARAACALGGAAACCAVLAAVDPNEPGRYPACLTQALLGVDCPLCGTLRGLHALLHGRIALAIDHNLLLVALVPAAVVGLALVALPLLGRRTPRVRWSPLLVTSLVVLAIGFAVARNLPFDALAPLAAS